MIVWNDQHQAAHLANGLLSARREIAIQQELAMGPILTAFANRNDAESRDAALRVLRAVRSAHDALWRDPFLPERVVESLSNEIRSSELRLRDLGATELDLARIDELEGERRTATMALVTTLTIDSAKFFDYAEANRNLPPGAARDGASVIRQGFSLQALVDEWWIPVALTLRRMGYRRNERLDAHVRASEAAAAASSCGVYLREGAGGREGVRGRSSSN